jgi:hypothetical protein
MITEGQVLNMVDALEKRVQARDSSQSVRIQSARQPNGETMYIIHIENATMHDQYEVDSATHQWIRKIFVDE